MNNSNQENNVLKLSKGEDYKGENHSLGISTIAFKNSSQDNNGVFIVENTFHGKGGPALHLHYDQDEWFFALEGEFLIEVGGKRLVMHPGDSVLGPRKVPHVWAFNGEGIGKMLIIFSPAGDMERFFREVTKANAMPPLDPDVWRDHGMELLGPPLINS
jgi:mannose-6-phosphate isomerase-like protein (cupin superfamily)